MILFAEDRAFTARGRAAVRAAAAGAAAPGAPRKRRPGSQGRAARPGSARSLTGVLPCHLPDQLRHLRADRRPPSTRRARNQHQPSGQADEHQAEHPSRHKPVMLPARRPSPQENPQVSHLLLTVEEMLEALHDASGMAYRAPGAAS